MGDGQDGGLPGRGWSPIAQQTLPQRLLCLHIQGAGEVVEDEQGRLAHKHARRGRPLYLPARQTHAARPHDRGQPLFQGGYVWFQHGGVDGGRQVYVCGGQPQQDVFLQ